ncbi:hypothetical protein C1646_756169 [Rhizophagus diaphanus]|nr:hypothetical protein C1646_756169 [Rhizophagus diaphanus] [Rhizophagus sp. MUCL 43196]
MSAKVQHEERLRKKAIKLSENPIKFITSTEKDIHELLTFQYRIEGDARMCEYARRKGKDPCKHMEMSVQERLIREEIIRQKSEDKGETSPWLDTNKEWKKMVLKKYNLSVNSTLKQLSEHAKELGTYLPEWKARKCIKDALRRRSYRPKSNDENEIVTRALRCNSRY